MQKCKNIREVRWRERESEKEFACVLSLAIELTERISGGLRTNDHPLINKNN